MSSRKEKQYQYNKGVNMLTEKFQSNVLLTPQTFNRMTISPENFVKYNKTFPNVNRRACAWGYSSSYGGAGPVSLPNNEKVQKYGLHYGSGIHAVPRRKPAPAIYQVTNLHRSHVRNTDELIQDATKVNLTEEKLKSPYPQEHSFTSHIPKTKLFPNFEPTNNTDHGINSSPSNEYPACFVIEKAMGNPQRYERIKIPLNNSKKVVLHDDRNYNQINRLSKETSDVLSNVRKSHYTSVYQHDFNYSRAPSVADKENAISAFSTGHDQKEITVSQNTDNSPGHKGIGIFRPKAAIRERNNHIDINALQQSWSPTKMHRQLHVKYTDSVPSLRRVPDVRITPQEKRHFIPEAGYVPSHLLNGIYY